MPKDLLAPGDGGPVGAVLALADPYSFPSELLLDERHPLFDSLEDEAIASLLRRALEAPPENR